MGGLRTLKQAYMWIYGRADARKGLAYWALADGEGQTGEGEGSAAVR
jgi:hypothetical protein